MSKIFYDNINDRAKSRFTKSFNDDSLDEWSKIWFESAEEIKAEFEAEGLINSAKDLQNIIDFNRKFFDLIVEKKKFNPSLEETIKIIEAPMIEKPELNEPVLKDDYPMYTGYFYVVDDVVTENDFNRISVQNYKQKTGARQVRRCDIYGRIAKNKK